MGQGFLSYTLILCIWEPCWSSAVLWATTATSMRPGRMPGPRNFECVGPQYKEKEMARELIGLLSPPRCYEEGCQDFFIQPMVVGYFVLHGCGVAIRKKRVGVVLLSPPNYFVAQPGYGIR
ncbi:hypothetical protein B0J14DRAFT_148101 [Halenospora varia]|nr:hypothetical protein B0J14DRAFT_148101 [Halenospora varia]